MSRQTSNDPPGSWKMILLLVIVGAAALMISPVSADAGSPAGTGSDGTVTINRLVQLKYYIWEDTVTFTGTNTGSGTTYLFITGPNLKPNGAQIQSMHPFQSPVTDGDASTFQAARVGPDNTWSYTWDTNNVMIDSGMYTVYAASTPRDLSHINSTHFDRISVLMVPPRGLVQPAETDTSNGIDASAGTGVTISAVGDKSYYQGEKVVLRGQSPDADTVYLFMTGPNLPDTGGKLTSPYTAVVSGNPDSFTLVKTKPDKSWEYIFYTANLQLGAGTYSVYAVNQPITEDPPGPGAASVGMALKKPFITANISSPDVVKGHPFTVTGIAEGTPPEVRIWILGNNYSYTTKTPVSSDASFTFTADTGLSGKLPAGQNWLIVQHPMADNQSDFVVSGDFVRNLKLDNGTNIFRLTGPGSLQGSDAADALIAAITDQEGQDKTYTCDMYTMVPFRVSAPVSVTTGVTIAASGTRSYYQGEKVVFSGRNYDSDTTYLFITGPGTFVNGPGVPDNGGKLTSPRQGVVSGNPGSFDTAKTKADMTWEYAYYTHNLNVDAGTYTVYAVSQPKAKDQLNGVSSADIGIILKKPFLTGNISPASMSKGEPFTVSGTAEGDPESVRIWILGKNYYTVAPESVNTDASYKYEVPREVASHLEDGQNFVIVQHSMQNNRFDIDITGDYVRNLNLNNGTNLFRISGPGSLQGSDAADALVAAFSDQKTTDDTYSLIPFQITDAGSPASRGTDAATAPFQSPAQPSLVPFALIGAAILVLGIIWKGH